MSCVLSVCDVIVAIVNEILHFNPIIAVLNGAAIVKYSNFSSVCVYRPNFSILFMFKPI